MAEPCSAQEVLWRLGPKAALSHEEAARRHGIELVDDDETKRITVPRNRSRAKAPGWKVVRADLNDADVLDLDGERMTSALRTVVDLCRVLRLEQAVAAADSALRKKLITLAALLAVLSTSRGRGAQQIREVGRLVDPLSGSVLESLLRVLILTSTLPVPRTQYLICRPSGDLVARVDFCWPALRLIVEADGFAFHSDRTSYRADRQRMNDLEVLGWKVLRFTWEDVVSRPRYVLETIRACVDLAEAA